MGLPPAGSVCAGWGCPQQAEQWCGKIAPSRLRRGAVGLPPASSAAACARSVCAGQGRSCCSYNQWQGKQAGAGGPCHPPALQQRPLAGRKGRAFILKCVVRECAPKWWSNPRQPCPIGALAPPVPLLLSLVPSGYEPLRPPYPRCPYPSLVRQPTWEGPRVNPHALHPPRP